MNGSVRARYERALSNERETRGRKPQGPTPAQLAAAEDERRERLLFNAKKIQEDRINLMLLDMTEDERSVVFEIVNRESPQNLGNAVVLEALLLRVRNEGVSNLRDAMTETTREEQSAVWKLLQEGSAASRLGMDGGVGCRTALQIVKHQQFVEEN
jgi:hypothetical protein